MRTLNHRRRHRLSGTRWQGAAIYDTRALVERLEDRVMLAAQIVEPTLTSQTVGLGANFGIDVRYDVTDPAASDPTGLQLLIHYDSQVLTFTGLQSVLSDGHSATQDQLENTSDGDPATDRVVNVFWVSISGGWPGSTSLPADLLRAGFTAANTATSTTVNFTGSSAPGYEFESTPVAITISADGPQDSPSDIDQQLGFNSEATASFNYGGQQDKWLRAANGDWYILLPAGTLVKWDGTANSASGTTIATFDTGVYDNPALLYDAYQPGTGGSLAEIDEELGFKSEATGSFNYGGQQDKWLRAANRDWYILLTDGTLLKWDGAADSASGTTVASLGADVYANPALLYNAFQPNLSTDPAQIDEELGFSSEATGSFNYGGQQDKWLRAANRDWYILLTDGTLVKWDGTKNSTSGTAVAKFSANVYSDPSLLFDAFQVDLGTDLAAIDEMLGFTGEATGSFNYGGEQDKWLRAANGDWYILLPDGSLVQWGGAKNSAAGPTVAMLGSDVYANPSLLFDAFQIDLGSDPVVIDQTLGLNLEDESSFNYGGRNEKWLRTAGGDWYILLPDGSLLQWDGKPNSATGNTVATLTPEIYTDATLLYDAYMIDLGTDLAEIDQMLGFTSETTASFNYGGEQEKWLRAGNGDWYLLVPDGRLIQWDGSRNTATGVTVAELDVAVYNDPALLYNAAPASPPLIDAFFAEQTDL